MAADRNPTSTPAQTQAQRRATTEARLLDAAFGIVADNSVRAVTTTAVGEIAGYSRGIVNAHFGSRDQLMTSLAGAVQARFTPYSENLRGRARVLNVVDNYLATIRSSPRDMRVFLRLSAAAIGDEEPSLRAAFVRRDAFFRDYFEDAITEGVADGSIHADIDATATAVVLVGLVRGIAMQCQVSPALADDETLRESTLALLEGGLARLR